MRRIHLLRVGEGPRAFAPLLAAAAAAAVRLGWLELAAPAPLPAEARDALLAGAERMVAVGEGWTLSARRRPGAPVLRELLRQQFLGCAAVLVHGEVEAPRLAPLGGDSWSVQAAGGPERRLGTAELLSALRAPRPFAPAEPVR
jgi:hypothetical protein